MKGAKNRKSSHEDNDNIKDTRAGKGITPFREDSARKKCTKRLEKMAKIVHHEQPAAVGKAQIAHDALELSRKKKQKYKEKC